jgi:murein DD-endopeptidase MepM/ murein hydrolase activator NlpD
MNSLVGGVRPSSPLRAIALALVTVGLAGCSGESRFGEGPYAARGVQGDATGSISQGAPVGHVESRPLPQTSQLPPPQTQARAAPVESPIVAGGGRGMASYAPPVAPYNPPAAPPAYAAAPAQVAYSPPPGPAAYNAPAKPPVYSPPAYAPASYHPGPGPEITGSVAEPRAVAAPQTVAAPQSVLRKPTPSGQWSWDGGTAITVAPGETIEGIAHRHGVPVAVIMDANKLSSPNAIQAGQRLVIPRYAPALAAPAAAPAPTRTSALAAPPAPAPKPAPVVAAPPAIAPSPAAHAGSPVNPGVHVVAPGETLIKIAHQYGKSVAEIAKANNILPYSRVSIGDRLVIPGVRISNAKADAEPPTAPGKPTGNNKVLASAAPAQSASMVSQSPDTPATETAAKAAADPTPGFRWPVRGRIIAGFGPKPNGQQNDGIDVAVPENTPVKAAEDGVVAYAGNELKGYGNLVLVRHPNGYVTAYAHAKELLVKRGDQIKRGEVIAKSGQSGNVDAPQLHFEVRKGSAPVDPMQFLNGA